MPVGLMLRSMSAQEYRAWIALAMIEGEIAALAKGGTDYAIAERMVWTPTRDDEDEPSPNEEE
jgi:hypothetical protein